MFEPGCPLSGGGQDLGKLTSGVPNGTSRSGRLPTRRVGTLLEFFNFSVVARLGQAAEKLKNWD